MLRSNIKVLMKELEQRTGQRMSYALISQETGIARSAIAKLANNKSQMIALSTLNALCNYFRVDPGKILLWTPDNTSHQSEISDEQST